MDTTITLHKENIELFLERLENLNRKLEKKNQPKVEYFVSGFDVIDWENVGNVPVLEITLRSTMTTSNIKGIDVKFEGVVDLINQEENSRIFHVENPNIRNLLPECECDECHKRIGRRTVHNQRTSAFDYSVKRNVGNQDKYFRSCISSYVFTKLLG